MLVLTHTHTHTHTHTLSLSQVLRKAVYGMLPKNKLRKKYMNRLHLFPDEVRERERERESLVTVENEKGEGEKV